MKSTVASTNKLIVIAAFEALFNKCDYEVAKQYWSDHYIQHSADIAPGREGLFELVWKTPLTMRYEPGPILAGGDLVMMHGRFSGIGLPANLIVVDMIRMKHGLLVERWDVIQNGATRTQSKSGNPMFGNAFPE